MSIITDLDMTPEQAFEMGLTCMGLTLGGGSGGQGFIPSENVLAWKTIPELETVSVDGNIINVLQTLTYEEYATYSDFYANGSTLQESLASIKEDISAWYASKGLAKCGETNAEGVYYYNNHEYNTTTDALALVGYYSTNIRMYFGNRANPIALGAYEIAKTISGTSISTRIGCINGTNIKVFKELSHVWLIDKYNNARLDKGYGSMLILPNYPIGVTIQNSLWIDSSYGTSALRCMYSANDGSILRTALGDYYVYSGYAYKI